MYMGTKDAHLKEGSVSLSLSLSLSLWSIISSYMQSCSDFLSATFVNIELRKINYR